MCMKNTKLMATPVLLKFKPSKVPGVISEEARLATYSSLFINAIWPRKVLAKLVVHCEEWSASVEFQPSTSRAVFEQASMLL